MFRLAAALVCLSMAAAWADEPLTGVSKDGGYYRLGADTVCKPLSVDRSGTTWDYPECQIISKKGQAKLGIEPLGKKSRRFEARLVAARPSDASPPREAPAADPMFGKPPARIDDRLELVDRGPDGKEGTVVAYWARHPEVAAVEAVYVSRNGKTAVVVYDYHSEARATIVESAVGFRLK